MQLNAFIKKTDNKIKPLEASWVDIIQIFTNEHHTFPKKHQAKLFNAAEYLLPSEIPGDSDDLVKDKDTGEILTARRQVNLVHNHILVLDYDSDVTLEETLLRFKKYELIYYTSHSHLADDITHKFRILIPFHKPVPSHKKSNSVGDWYRIVEPLKEFAGPGCDPKSFDPNQIYEMPSAPKERMHLAQSGHNKGTKLNWDEFKQSDVEPVSRGYSASKRASVPSSGQYLDPDQILETDQGPIRVKDVVGKIDGVVCPFHNDKKGSEFVRKVETTENIFLFCKKCNCKYYMKDQETDSRREATEKPKKLTKKQEKLDRDKRILDFLHTEDIFDLDVVYEDAEDRSKVIEQLGEIQREIESDDGWKFVPENPKTHRKYVKNYASHIIYMPEGAGKSRLVVDMATNGRKIIFACKSWAQAESKFEEYSNLGKKRGFKTDIVRSKDAKTRRRFNTKLLRRDPRGPYDSGAILDKESIQQIIKNNPKLSEEFIQFSWNFFSSDVLLEKQHDESRFKEEHETRIVITTFEQLRIYKLKKNYIPIDWTVWFDDPDINDAIDIEPYELERWKPLSDKKLIRETRETGGHHYFKRGFEQSLGYTLLKNQCIYTTTEFVTMKAIQWLMRKRGEKQITHDKMSNLFGGKITILGTESVRRRYDGLIPAFARRLKKLKMPVTLIADGLATKWNHSNNKGSNELSKVDLLVELSIPHEHLVKTICDALELEYHSHKHSIRIQLMLDRLHQAIGRNSGYRYEGSECVVLVDKMHHKEMINETRYLIDTKNSVIIDQTQRLSRLEKHVGDDATPLVKQIVKLLNNVNAYIGDFRKCKPDIKFVLDAIDDIEKQHSFVTRILASLCSHSGINLEDEMLDETPPQSKYRELSNWILDTWIPTDRKQEILKNIKSILEGKVTVSWTGDLDKYHRLWQEWSENPKRFEEKYMNIQTTTQA